MKKDQKTLLCEALTKMQEMSGDSFLKISEITRRRVAKGLLYEDVTLDQFDSIRKYVLTEATWYHTNFNTEDEIIAELGRLRDAKDRDNLPSIAYENIDNHINILNDKLANLNKQIISTKAEVPTNFTESCKLLESILDPINKVRCSEIFDKNDMMLPKVREYILGIVEKFKEHVNFPLNVRNIYMIGSSTGYQYTLTSDVDIEVELGITDDQKWELLPIVPKGTFLPGTQKPINLFILSKDESYDFDKAENVYDVERNKWLKNTGKKNVEIPYQYIRDLATYFMNGCDHSISNYEKDVRELDEYIGLDPEHQEISVKEKFEAIDRKLIDVKNDVDQIKMAHHVIFAFENEGYDGKPFRISIQGVNDPDPRYSVNNLVYKMIDKHGYHDKMKEIIKVGAAKIKEVEKYISENKGDRLDEEVLSENREYDKYLNLIKDSLADDGKEAEEILKEGLFFNRIPKNLQMLLKNYEYYKNNYSKIGYALRDKKDIEKSIKSNKKGYFSLAFNPDLLYNLSKDQIKIGTKHISINDFNNLKKYKSVFEKKRDIERAVDYLVRSEDANYIDLDWNNEVKVSDDFNNIKITVSRYQKEYVFNSVSELKKFIMDEKNKLKLISNNTKESNTILLPPYFVQEKKKFDNYNNYFNSKEITFLTKNGFNLDYLYIDGGGNFIFKKNKDFYHFSHEEYLDEQIPKKIIFKTEEEEKRVSFMEYNNCNQDNSLKEAEDVESVNDKTTVLNNLRSDIQDEYTAIKGYDAHADFAEKNGCSDIAKIIRDIRDEEKVHIGELEAVMKKYDKEFKDSLTDGGKEAEEILKEDREYTKYVKGHIKNLKSGYRWLKKYLPEIFPKGYFNDENHKIRRAIRNHDKSKWGKDEYKAYSDFQQIRKIPNLSDEEYDAKKGEFNVAWNHHQKGNRHHWQYWVLTNANGSTKVLDMPYENIIEMICDWWTFSWKENNMRAIFDWYAKNKDSMILSPKTRSTVENILSKMKKKIGELEREKLNEASRNTYYHTCPKCGANLDPGERCDCDREPEKKEPSEEHDDKAKKAVKVADYRPGLNPGQLQFTFGEAIDVKKEYDGKSLEVELDADLDLGDGKTHHIKSKNLDLSLTKKDGKLDLEVDIETDIKEKNDENIEKYNKKLKSDMAAAKEAGVPSDIASVLYEALAELSDKQIGALIAIENKQNLDKYCENGTPMNCPISKDIFMSIFYPGTEVHDGATIIKDGVIKYSSVFFKNISGDDFDEHYGARHRAAMGLSKETDAFCIVVSEESGNISFAVDGKLEVIKADDVKSSRERFISLYNENRTNKTISESINEALLLKEQSKAFGLTTKKEDLPDVKTGDAFKVTFYDNGEYVGEASVSDDYDGDKLCFCYNIDVKKELRGQGYGTKIMKYMIEKYHIKSLQVAPDNDVAIHLYKKLGFKKTGEVRMSKTRVDDRMELPSKKRLEPYLDEEADPFYMTTDYMKYHILTNYFDIDGKDFDEIDMNVLKNIKVSDIKRDRYYMNADNDKLERLLNRTINNMISDLTKKINNAKILLQSIKRDPNNNVIRTEIKPLVYRNNSSDPDIEVSCGHIIGTEALGGYFTQKFSYKKILCILGSTKNSVKVLVYGDEGVEVKYISGNISNLLKNINVAYRNK